jgi:hypothetical protein
MAAMVTGSFVIAASGGFYALRGFISSGSLYFARERSSAMLPAVAFPTGDRKPDD